MQLVCSAVADLPSRALEANHLAAGLSRTRIHELRGLSLSGLESQALGFLANVRAARDMFGRYQPQGPGVPATNLDLLANAADSKQTVAAPS